MTNQHDSYPRRTVDLAGNSTFYEYHPSGGSGAGQLKKVTHADGAYTSYVYDAHGRVTEQTGSADYPVRYTYDSTDGWMTHMKTYRDSIGDGDPLTSTAGNGTYESDTESTSDTATGQHLDNAIFWIATENTFRK